jgi:hypothetical protein
MEDIMEAEGWILVTGLLVLGAGQRSSRLKGERWFRVLGSGFSVPGSGFWVLRALEKLFSLFWIIEVDVFYKFEIFNIVSQKFHSPTNDSCCNQGIRDMKAVAFGIFFDKVHSCLTDFLIDVDYSQLLKPVLDSRHFTLVHSTKIQLHNGYGA